MKKILLYGPKELQETLGKLWPDAAMEAADGLTRAQAVDPYAAYDLLVFSPTETQAAQITQQTIADLLTYVTRGGTMLVLSDGLWQADHPELSHLFGGVPVVKLPCGELSVVGEGNEKTICSALSVMDFAAFGTQAKQLQVAYGKAQYALLWTQDFCKGKCVCFAGDSAEAVLLDVAKELLACTEGRAAS